MARRKSNVVVAPKSADIQRATKPDAKKAGTNGKPKRIPQPKLDAVLKPEPETVEGVTGIFVFKSIKNKCAEYEFIPEGGNTVSPFGGRTIWPRLDAVIDRNDPPAKIRVIITIAE